MSTEMGGVYGNVHIVLTDKYGNIKQEMTKKNTITVSFLWQMMGSRMYANVTTTYLCLTFASNTAIPTKNFAGDTSTNSALYPLWNSAFYSYQQSPTPSFNPNPAEGNPYISATFYVAPGTGSGTIKTLYTSTYSYGAQYSSPSNIASYVVFNSNEWIIKGAADALTVTWLWYFAGNYKNNWF